MASGVLPIAIGDAPKMIPFVEENSPAVKEYLFSLQFGFETDTLDITGTEIARSNIVPTEEDVLAVLPKLIGKIAQIPPQYSAIHIDGKRAYDAARHGQVIEMPPRDVQIFELEFLGTKGDSWHFRTRCSTGTYVRSIGRDIAKLCRTLGTVDMIRRTLSGGFDIKSAVKLDFLENLFNNSGSIDEKLMPVDFGLGDIPVLNLSDKDADFYKNGGFVKTVADDGCVRAYAGSSFIGIGVITDGILRPKRTI
jgi:tRNA pseudouridine55 synthase